MSYPVSSLSVTGRSLNARSSSGVSNANVATPASPFNNMPISPPPFGPPSPSAASTSASTSAAPSPFAQHPSSPITRFNQGALLSITQQSAATAAVPSNAGGGGKFQVIQRPLASRVGPAQGGATFVHSLHPTAVQASHALGQANKMTSSSASIDGAKEKLPSVGAGLVGKKFIGSVVGGGGGVGSKDWYGTFPRLGSIPRLGTSPSSSSSFGGNSVDLFPPSPVRASPTATRSPDPFSAPYAHGSPSTLHPRPKTGIIVKGLRTPPSRGKGRPIRRMSDQSVDVGELGGSMADMDLGADAETPNSGYNSDASAISIESHVSSFQPDAMYAYSSVYGVPSFAHDIDVELADVSDAPMLRGGFPVSPLQLRAGAPHPNKMYGNITPLKSSSSGTNSVRSGSRADMNTSADHSALQSPHLDSQSMLLNKLGVASSNGGQVPMSPITAIDAIPFTVGVYDKIGSGVVPSPPHEFTTVPALNLPRSAATIAPAPRSPPTGGVIVVDTTALGLPSPNKLNELAPSGATSAFSSARSLAHSSLSSSSIMSSEDMDWQSTNNTARSGSSLYSVSTNSNASSLTNLLHATELSPRAE